MAEKTEQLKALGLIPAYQFGAAGHAVGPPAAPHPAMAVDLDTELILGSADNGASIAPAANQNFAFNTTRLETKPKLLMITADGDDGDPIGLLLTGIVDADRNQLLQLGPNGVTAMWYRADSIHNEVKWRKFPAQSPAFTGTLNNALPAVTRNAVTMDVLADVASHCNV